MPSVVSWGRSGNREFLMRDLFTYAKYSGMCMDITLEEYADVCTFLEECLPNTPRIAAWRVRTGRLASLPPRFCQQYNDFQMPRRTFKTSIVKALCSFAQELDPDIRIVLGRATNDMAENTLDALKDDLTRNEPLLQAFGDIRKRYSTWTTNKIIRSDRTPGIKEPTVDTTGLGQSQTGQHPDFVVLDDLVHEGNFESEQAMYAARKTVDSYDPILESWGSLLLVGTRWGDNDIHGYVQKRDKDLRERGLRPKFNSFTLGAYNADMTPRFPTALPETFLARQKEIISDKMFSSWYLNRVRTDGEDIFKESYFDVFEGDFQGGPFSELVFDDSDINLPLVSRYGARIPLSVVMLVDPAPTVGKSSDFTGIVVVGFDKDANYWVLHGAKVKMMPSDRLAEIIFLAQKYRPKLVAIENADMNTPLLMDKFSQLGIPCEVVAFDPRQDRKRITADARLAPRGRNSKAAQIEALEPVARARRIKLMRGTTTALHQQLLEYPYIDKDDVIDAFSMSRAYEEGLVQKVNTDPTRYLALAERREYELEGLDPETGRDLTISPRQRWAQRGRLFTTATSQGVR
jgi:phage terminase large subunit-like protein